MQLDSVYNYKNFEIHILNIKDNKDCENIFESITKAIDNYILNICKLEKIGINSIPDCYKDGIVHVYCFKTC